MKKLLLVSTALVGAAMLSSTASAAVKMDLGGAFIGYGVYADNSEATGTANSLYEFEFRRASNFTISGETTLDNGLTVGAFTDVQLADGSNALTVEEVYGYASGGWGRVNLGLEDGAAYLLQVAAPSADSNVDGMRPGIQGLNRNNANFTGGVHGVFSAATLGGDSGLDYGHADFQNTDRITYLSPKMNGFQGGVSFAPKTGQTSQVNGMALDSNGIGLVNVGGTTVASSAAYSNLWEVAARWDAEFQGFGVNVGAGYSSAETELDPTTAQVLALATQDYYINDGLDTYNFGAGVSYQGFSLGGVYMNTETSRIAETVAATTTGTGDIERETWVVGGSYDNGPYHVGASYLNQQVSYDGIGAGLGQAIAATEYESDRFTVGGGYEFGPGMTFRGAVAWGEFDATGTGSANDNDFTQVTVGTDVQF